MAEHVREDSRVERWIDTNDINIDQNYTTTGTVTGGHIKDSSLTPTRVVFSTTAGQLADDSDLTFSGDRLSATKVISTQVQTPEIKTNITDTADLLITTGSEKTLILANTVWDDLRVVPGSFDRPGVADPTIVAYDVNGGGVSTYLWQFQKNAIASFTIQIPHNYKQGTNLSAHIHWTPGPNGAAENGKTVGWKIQYSWANIDGAFGTMATLDLSDACNGVDHEHNITPEVAITGTSKIISSMLVCNVLRTDTGTDDTWAGTLSGALPMLLEIDFHYQLDTIGSRTIGTK